MEEEKWKNIDGYKDLYQVSNLGRIRNIKSDRVLRPAKLNSGYLVVNLLGSTKTIHRLVCSAFLRKENENDVVNHLDGDKLNNKLSNLEWTTQSKNVYHSYSIGKSKRVNRKDGYNPKGLAIIKCDLDGNLIKEYPSLIEASIENKKDKSSIWKALNGHYKTSCGCTWFYSSSSRQTIHPRP